MDIYDAIVNGFKKRIPSSQGIEAFLQSLQSSVKSLRIAYRNNPVYVPYEKTNIQAAYLATYLPHYYQLIYKIFIEEVPDIFKGKKEVYLNFIGGGPGSEAYGAIKYILNNCTDVEIIHISILDINASTWDYSHAIVSENLVETVNNGKTQIYWKSIPFDLTSLANISQSKAIIEKSDLLVIQNCLNEIAKVNLPSLKTNVKTLFDYLPGDAYLLMSDMTSVARPIMKVLEGYLVESFSPKFLRTTLSSCSRSLISVHHRPSAIIAQNLLVSTDGLIPRKNISYDYSILSKGFIEEPLDSENLGFSAIYRPLDFKNLDANDFIHRKIFIGIDFGTSSTVISTAQLVGGSIVIKAIPIKQKDHLGSLTRNPIVPTIISLVDGKKLLVGIHAADFKPYLVYGKNTWHSFKQNLGHLDEIKYNNSDLATNPNFKISNATEALILFFAYIKREIFEYLKDNGLPNEVEYSISIPAGFPSKEKQTLRSCLLNAGIECEDTPFIEEPNAALINYLYEQNIFVETNEPKNILVLDLGAGTVDVSILCAEKGDDGFTSKLLSVVRLGNIGGNLIDELMADAIIQNFNINAPLNELHRIELVSLCEKLKIKICKDLIVDSTTNFELPSLSKSDDFRAIPSTSNLISLGISSISLSFKEFSNLMSLYWNGSSAIDGIKGTLDKSLVNAGLSVSMIDKIIVTGGGGRNPYIKNQVANYFKGSELFISDNIQEQVSRGVALQSFVLNSFGKNIITPILGHDIYLKGINKTVTLFENGISIPSLDIEILLDEPISEEILSIECYSNENKNYCKYFVIPAKVSISKLLFYIAPDQELRCEIVGPTFEKEALEIFKKSNNKLIKIRQNV
jgi:molecular chaperone DnaK (HSP70)